MTGADFDAITHDRALCDADGAIDAAGFEAMMREQVRAQGGAASATRRREEAAAQVRLGGARRPRYCTEGQGDAIPGGCAGSDGRLC